MSHLITLIVTATILLSACNGNQGTEGSQSNGGNQGNSTDGQTNHNASSIGFSTVADGVWPPQPVGVTNTEAYVPQTVTEDIRSIKSSDLHTVILRNEQVLAAIGPRYQHLGSYQIESKSPSAALTEIEFFNYTSNHVVTVIVNNDITIRSTPASEYQPAETDAEIDKAISLAAEHLRQLGYPLSDLKGSALLAHPTAKQFTENGKPFYEHRVLYVTFGHGDGQTPLYRATVDLSDEKIIYAGPL